jgi:hypothetical protein
VLDDAAERFEKLVTFGKPLRLDETQMQVSNSFGNKHSLESRAIIESSAIARF